MKSLESSKFLRIARFVRGVLRTNTVFLITADGMPLTS